MAPRHGLSGPKKKFLGKPAAPPAAKPTAVVLSASGSSDSASASDDDDGMSEEEAVLQNPSEESGEEEEALRWGRSAKNYYKEGESSGEDSMDEDDELKEAIRIQRAREDKVQGSDYAIASDEDEEDEDVPRRATASASKSNVEMLAAEAPEVLALLGEMQTNVATIVDTLKPTLQRLRSGESKTSLGVTLMESKLHLLLSYTINVAFYLMLRAESGGARAESHPVVAELVRLRTALEKLRPLDNKLKQQLDALTARLHDEAEGVGGSDDDQAAMNGGRNEAPPMLESLETAETAMTRADALPDKKQRKEQRRMAKVRDSELLQGLRAEMSEAPEEIVEPTAQRSAEDEARRKYEEENFTRLPETKKERATRKQRNSGAQAMDTVASSDFKAIEALLGDLVEDNNDNDERSANANAARSLGNALQSMPLLPDEEREDLEGDDSLYMEMRNNQSRKRARKAESYAFPQRYTPAKEAALGAEQPRKASHTMIKNRGLTPHRPKDAKNPRKHIRDKFEKKVKARKGQVRDMRSEGDAYQGEATGIRSQVVRSRLAGS